MSYDHSNTEFPKSLIKFLKALEADINSPLAPFRDIEFPDLPEEPEITEEYWENLRSWYLTEVPRYYQLLMSTWGQMRVRYTPRANKTMRSSKWKPMFLRDFVGNGSVRRSQIPPVSLALLMGYLLTQPEFRMTPSGHVNVIFAGGSQYA